MLSFHNDPAIKEEYLNRVRAHAKADEIVKGQYWSEGRGCAVGCTIHGSRHKDYETKLGIPEIIAYLEDHIFEKIPVELAMTWPLRFLETIPVGKDLSKVWPQFAIFLLIDSTQCASRHPSCGVVATAFAKHLDGETVDWKPICEEAWEQQRSTAATANAAAATAATAAYAAATAIAATATAATATAAAAAYATNATANAAYAAYAAYTAAAAADDATTAAANAAAANAAAATAAVAADAAATAATAATNATNAAYAAYAAYAAAAAADDANAAANAYAPAYAAAYAAARSNAYIAQSEKLLEILRNP